jgi:DNA-directed RNA polymerase subunit RPC12/RpoP
MNRGFRCAKCSNITDKPNKKGKRLLCPSCSSEVVEWERPLNERPGYCGFCENTTFKLLINNHNLHRICKKCGVTLNIDTNEVINVGDMERNKRV